MAHDLPQHLPEAQQKTAMERNQLEEDMRTALRQAAAIAAVDGPQRIRVTLCLAHDLYDAMLRMTPEDRARRIGLIDAMFGPAGADR